MGSAQEERLRSARGADCSARAASTEATKGAPAASTAQAASAAWI